MTVERAFSKDEMIGLCKGLWKGGYFEGDPEDPYGRSGYEQMGFISTLYAVYQVCIRPYLHNQACVLEIGPGRGAWTKTMLAAKEIWCLDVNTASHNGFWNYVGEEHRGRVKYIQTDTFDCRELPDNHFDLLFSYGTFCHIPPEGQRAYLRALLPKLRVGAVGSVMVADYEKHNAAVAKYNDLGILLRRYAGNGVTLRRMRDVGRSLLDAAMLLAGRLPAGLIHGRMSVLDSSKVQRKQGAWFHTDLMETCRFAESVGWQVVNPDIGLSIRDPIVQLRRPG